MRIQKYINRMIRKFKIDSGYKAWLLRATRIQVAYKNGYIKKEELEKFQLFLLQTGQFNANFTLEELVRLNYPRSPFSMMHTSDYLRCVDSWAMEILRGQYQKEYNTKFSHPIWVDSSLVLRELQRYCKVKIVSDYTVSSTTSREVYDEIERYKEDKNFRFLMFIENKETATFVEHEQSIKERLLPELKNHLIDIFIEKSIENIIFSDFLKQFQRDGKQSSFIPEETLELLSVLDKFFPEISEKNSASYNSKINQADKIITEKNIAQKNVKSYFYHFKKELQEEGIKSFQGLEEVSKNSEGLVSIFQRVKSKITPKKLSLDHYFNSVSAWIDSVIMPNIKNIFNKMIFYSSCQHRDMSGVVVYNLKNFSYDEEHIFSWYDWSNSLGHVSSILDHLGYRIDPVRVLRILLKIFPLLFVDIEQTNSFWSELLNTSMVQGLASASDEINQIVQLGKAAASTIATGVNIFVRESEEIDFDNNSFLLENAYSGEDQKYIHSMCVAIFLKAYEEFHLHSPGDFFVSRFIVGREIKAALYHFKNSEDIAIRTRCVQTISEIMNLYFEDRGFSRESDFPTLIDSQIAPYLSSESGVITSMTPYAMRAFVRVFQLLEGQHSLSRIYVTNQAYYELLANLENMHSTDVHISMVQTLLEIKSDADIFFIEIHPNNVIASYQFKHDINYLLDAMKAWNKRRRTMVIDVTLNMINDAEILDLLVRLDVFVAQGWLNIILIQSLTKFMQLGLDQRSGGMLVVINNPSKWQIFDKINDINQHEVIDVSTIKFFSFFMWMADFLLEYIKIIKKNCRYVYQKTVQNINDFETSETNLCQLLVSSDNGSCYIGLNINSLLAQADPTFSLGVEDAEQFLMDVLKYFIIPICKALQLPLTERTSIGFPLSGINIAFASLRMTIGLECEEQLNSYAWMLAYLVFMLNRKSCIKHCYSENDDERAGFLSLHANQFIAVYTNKQYGFDAEIIGQKFHVNIKGMNVYLSRILREIQGPLILSNKTILLGEYLPGFRLSIIQNNGVSVDISLLSNTAHQLMIIDYLSYPDEYPGDFCQIDDVRKEVVLSSQFILKERYFYLYGPYPIDNTLGFNSVCLGLGSNGRDRLLYCFPDKAPVIWLNPTGMKMFFADMFSLVKKGNILTAIYDMPFSEFEFLMKEGAYASNEKPVDHPYIKADDSSPATFLCHRQYIPAGNMQLHCINLDRFPYKEIIIEHDFICYQTDGVTAYKRKLGNAYTGIEIDYWMIKDPVARRFLSLMIAIYSKENDKINFISRDQLFNHFLFEMSYEKADQSFEVSIQIVMRFQSELIVLLEKYGKYRASDLSGQAFMFFESAEHQMQWPSGSRGVGLLNNRELIVDGLRILGKSP